MLTKEALINYCETCLAGSWIFSLPTSPLSVFAGLFKRWLKALTTLILNAFPWLLMVVE